MAHLTSCSKSTVQDFIDGLHNEPSKDTPEQRQTPPRSYVSPVNLSTNSESLYQHMTTPLGTSSSSVSTHTLSGRTSSSHTITGEPPYMSSGQNMDPNQFNSRQSFSQNRSQQYRIAAEIGSTRPSPAQTSNPFLTWPSIAQSDNQVPENVQNDPFETLSSVFEPPIRRAIPNQFSTPAGYLPSRKPYDFFRRAPFNNFGSSATPRLRIVPSTNAQLFPVNASQTFQVQNTPVIVEARHDRNSLYAVRTRADGSKSLIEVSLPLKSKHKQSDLSDLAALAIGNDTLPKEEVDQREDDNEDYETTDEFDNRLIHWLKQMMFVSGEQAEPSTETTWMIEEIVRDQVIEMLKEATLLANRRGSKSISTVDLIFQIRHNPAKVSRLKTFLSWKDVRKNVKDSDDKAGGADADALDLEDAAGPGANPAAPQKSSTNKKAKLILPWEIHSYYSETVPEREDEEDEEEEEQNEATLARLASADERTRNMTKDEYVYWSECRQASFTFRKGKRFREWAGFGTVIDSKPNDDVVDILGFLTFEIVQTLTEEALKVKAAEDLANKKASGLRSDNESAKKRKREGCTLFEMPEEGRTTVEPKHVREAFRRLQIVPRKYIFMRQGFAGVRSPLRMI